MCAVTEILSAQVHLWDRIVHPALCHPFGGSVMKTARITASLVAAVMVAAIVASCSSDSSAGDPLSAADISAAQASIAFAGGGWSPAAEAASNDKVLVCHSGNGKHYTQLSLPPQAARAHLGDPATGRGGHVGDFRVSTTTSCPPSSTPGQVQICKVA